MLLSIYREKVIIWTKLNFGDAKGFRQFYNFLEKCEFVARGQGDIAGIQSILQIFFVWWYQSYTMAWFIDGIDMVTTLERSINVSHVLVTWLSLWTKRQHWSMTQCFQEKHWRGTIENQKNTAIENTEK